jgi:hypothetical protein
MLAVEFEVPVTVMALLPITPRNVVGTCAENRVVEVRVPPVFVTVAVMLLSVKPPTPDMLPLNILVASVAPSAIGPSEPADLTRRVG